MVPSAPCPQRGPSRRRSASLTGQVPCPNLCPNRSRASAPRRTDAHHQTAGAEVREGRNRHGIAWSSSACFDRAYAVGANRAAPVHIASRHADNPNWVDRMGTPRRSHRICTQFRCRCAPDARFRRSTARHALPLTVRRKRIWVDRARAVSIARSQGLSALRTPEAAGRRLCGGSVRRTPSGYSPMVAARIPGWRNCEVKAIRNRDASASQSTFDGLTR